MEFIAKLVTMLAGFFGQSLQLCPARECVSPKPSQANPRRQCRGCVLFSPLVLPANFSLSCARFLLFEQSPRLVPSLYFFHISQHLSPLFVLLHWTFQFSIWAATVFSASSFLSSSSSFLRSVRQKARENVILFCSSEHTQRGWRHFGWVS